MKKILIRILCFILITCTSQAQSFSSYHEPMEKVLYSTALNDSVSVDLILPKEWEDGSKKEYPVIYLLDRQLDYNFRYNLQTIDYLSTLQWMPKAVVVGISFSSQSRVSWTVPNDSGGKADDLIRFIEWELNSLLKDEYPVSDFHLLIGHSRTAIFASYALSARPEFFNGVIASSVSHFDFGDGFQLAQFEEFLQQVAELPHHRFYYFSVGEEKYGDLHETPVDSLYLYLNSRLFSENLKWKFYKHAISHQLTPGLTVGQALSDIFKDYGRRVLMCFDIAKKSPKEVPWKEFDDLYASLSSDLGFRMEPSELFFNSVASEYYNDYEAIYRESHLQFTLEILLRALDRYPQHYDYAIWIGEIYMTLHQTEKGKHYLDQSREWIEKDRSVSPADRILYLNEINSLMEME